MKEIYFKNLQIFDYEGSGEPLVFVHAFPLSSEMWNPQTEYFSGKFRVITYDVRGLGKSKTDNNQFTMETYADDFLSVLNHLNLDKVIACGLSMGGYILQRVYMKNPETFKALVLADTRSERDDNNGLINRSNAIENLKAGKRKQFTSEFLQKLVCQKSYENPGIRNFLENIIDRNSTDGVCGAQLALATRVDSTEYLKDFMIPVLILVGENDILTPVSSAESMNNRIPDSEMKIIKNSGHLSNIENSEEFNRCLSVFLEKFV